jgi:hypothetical protein
MFGFQDLSENAQPFSGFSKVGISFQSDYPWTCFQNGRALPWVWGLSSRVEIPVDALPRHRVIGWKMQRKGARPIYSILRAGNDAQDLSCLDAAANVKRRANFLTWFTGRNSCPDPAHGRYHYPNEIQ